MQPENWLIRVLIDGQERSDCGSQLTITATDATFSVRNPATYGPVQYPHGTTMAFDGLPPVLGVLNTAGTNTWDNPPLQASAKKSPLPSPVTAPICHHSWSLSATPRLCPSSTSGLKPTALARPNIPHEEKTLIVFLSPHPVSGLFSLPTTPEICLNLSQKL